MRISVDEAISGGVSDPRNITLMKMFALVVIGERAGSGLYGIHSIWAKNGLERPVLYEQYNPDRTVMKLHIETDTTTDDTPTITDATTDEALTTTDTTTDEAPTTTDKIDELLRFCQEPRSRQEMQDFLSLKNKNHFIKTYLLPLYGSGRLEMTIPDKPKSKNQKYRAT